MLISKRLVIITAFLIVILVSFIGLFFASKPLFLVDQQANNPTTTQGTILPYTVETYGNAWDGIITFGANNYLVVMNANGTLLDLRTSSAGGYGVIKNIAQDTLLFQGEPQSGVVPSAPDFEEHIWNVISNTTQDFPNVIGHHDCEYDPVNNTFLTLQNYLLPVGNNSYLIDKIVQLDPQGNTLRTWDCHDYMPLSEADPYNLTSSYDGQPVIDFTHANALYWDYNDSIIYLNVRHLNTFYAINQTTGSLIWACGQFGNFTLVDQNGNVVPSLWYHSHDLEPIAPNVFSMFNNDFDNITNYNSSSSQLLEISLNMQNMTAKTIWSWTAPPQYYSTYLGAAVLLPNGDWMGDFGPTSHEFVENQPWNFTDTGAVLIEVTPSGQIMRTITFPTTWSIYRMTIMTNVSQYAFSSALTPTLAPSLVPTPLPTELPTSPPTSTPASTAAPSPTPTPTSQPTASPTPSVLKPKLESSFMLSVDISVAIVAAVIIAVAVLVYVKKVRKR